MKRRWITLRAHAKINLCLEVLGRRPDGYHDLATVFQAISAYDTVRIELRGRERGLQILSDGWPVPRGPANLCWKAAAHFATAIGEGAKASGAGLLQGLAIRLVKRLPPGGGLGGGSSDAAAVLVGLNWLLGHPLTDERLLAVAADIGSDVAFFASGASAALAYGRGERIEPLPPAKDFWAVVAWPGSPVTTAWAYRQLSTADFSAGEAAAAVAAAMREGRLDLWASGCRNAFLRPVTAAREDLRRLIDTLTAIGAAPVSLAGSGACVWGRFPDPEAAEAAAWKIRSAGLWACTASSAAQGVEIADVSE